MQLKCKNVKYPALLDTNICTTSIIHQAWINEKLYEGNGLDKGSFHAHEGKFPSLSFGKITEEIIVFIPRI